MHASGSGRPLHNGTVVVMVVVDVAVIVEVVHELQRTGHLSEMIGPSEESWHIDEANCEQAGGSAIP